ncbi:hypothetical protein I5677_07030 [Mobilitalea sibirica]|uniref:Uncharacterized protein n=1 Tax=Mobilitalea sibirica TaxID=1462919 RepID=A0A8J7KZP2_9FIRM|nr:hypothetical protein [Mobilitalea sibirica]MBH1940638.1 hypothetical protein [Mobilitalea sibirica]
MENINKLLYVALGTLIFCIGIFLMFVMAMNYHKTLATTREIIKNDNLYQQYFTKEKEFVTHGELIATLLQPLDYNLSIDGVLILLVEHNEEKIIDYNIREVNYIKSYQRDAIGNIICMEYTGN